MLSLSGLYSVEKKLRDALESRVWMRSGAYLVIEPTEALTVIDVNSGKYESEKDANDTYLKINLEAAEEVARQLRLRNLSGIIIVDFINMQLPGDQKELLQYLKKVVSKDRIPTNVVDMTALGLVEITRKKINRPLLEQFRE
jgi:ribonuclease G